MTTQFKKGDQVVQVVAAPIVGKVTGFALCQETGEVSLAVEYADAEGAVHSRHFKQSEVAAVTAPTAG